MMSTAKPPVPNRKNVSLVQRTTFRMGGETPLLLEPRNREEYVASIRFLREEGLSFRLLGGGANVIIDDRGITDAIVLTTGFSFMLRESEDGQLLRLAAGLSIPQFVTNATAMGRTGAERLVGIPGTIGGATAMNAGGRYGSLSDIARRVRVLHPSGKEDEVEVDDSTFGYRSSVFGPGHIVLETVVELLPGDRTETSGLIRKYLSEKSAAQPLTKKSAGCVFKNPEGNSAGRVLAEAKCNGMREGGAEVSEKHANFIINHGDATMVGVQALIERMRKAVYENSGINLENEVKLWSRESE